MLVGEMLFGEAEAFRGGTFDLPCFHKATKIVVDLWFLGLAMPPAGVFAKLTDLRIGGVRVHGPSELGEVVSTPRCPCLQKLTVSHVGGQDSVTINSESLRELELKDLRDVQQITIVAPELKNFSLVRCFIHDQNQPVVDISVPQLRSLKWEDAYDPSSVHLGTMEHLQLLSTFFSVYGLDEDTDNRACLMLLPQFKAINCLSLSLCHLPVSPPQLLFSIVHACMLYFHGTDIFETCAPLFIQLSFEIESLCCYSYST